MRPEQPYLSLMVLIATSLVCAVLGSIHAFSVFLEPLEIEFAASRTVVSLTYSLALVSLTCAVLIGPRFFARWSAASFILFVCTLAACGSLLAGMAGSLPVIWLGYSLIFGAANGLGYGFGLQIVAQVNPGREGMAMGIVTAAYALGAVLSPALFNLAIETRGFAAAMLSLAGVLVGVGVLGAALLHKAGAKFQAEKQMAAGRFSTAYGVPLLWLGYFAGVLAGLMVIGHAAGIAASLSPGMKTWMAPVIIAACNLLGSLIAGRLADRLPLAGVLAALALLTTVALAALAVFAGVTVLVVGLALVGFAYGGTIAAYPAAIAKLFGIEQSARIYGRVFTAWGCAGLIGPWIAGFLFDWSGDYRFALLTAASMGLISVLVVTVLFRRGRYSAM